MARILCICSQKGGVAKTTSTIEVASILKMKGFKVLVIDLDQQCNLSKNVGADLTKDTIYNVFRAECEIKEAIQQLDLFDCIAGSESLSRADKEFIDTDDIFILSDICDIIKESYDYILIDNGPARNNLLTMSYIAADYIIIPTEADESSIDSLVTTEKDINMLVNGRHHDSHAVVIGYLLTRAEKTTVLHQLALENLKGIAKKNPIKPFVLTVRKSIKAGEVKTFHTSMAEMYSNEPVSMDYQIVTEEMIKIMDKVEKKNKRI